MRGVSNFINILIVLTFVTVFAIESESALMFYYAPRQDHPSKPSRPSKSILPIGAWILTWSQYLKDNLELPLQEWLKQGQGMKALRFYRAYG